MQDLVKVLNNDERAVYTLRALYKSYGYSQYKMSKFEEYDLYVKNKEFLVSDNVITFTDSDGKLMALKPDVTLSIIKSNKDLKKGVKKVFYNENVYRASANTRSFKEIMQVGLECQGDVDAYTVNEVLMLAVKSLASISEDFVLDISNLKVVSAVLDDAGVRALSQKKILELLGDKNAEGIIDECDKAGIDKKCCEILTALCVEYGKPQVVINKLKELNLPKNAVLALEELENAVSELSRLGVSDKINLDFSVVNDMNYYNGIVFKGFISGIPTGVLSGGQYDLLMQKMGQNVKAIGFAVYLDELKKLSAVETENDVDVVVLYSLDTAVSDINDAVSGAKLLGKSVIAVKEIPDKLSYASIIDLTKGGN